MSWVFLIQLMILILFIALGLVVVVNTIVDNLFKNRADLLEKARSNNFKD